MKNKQIINIMVVMFYNVTPICQPPPANYSFRCTQQNLAWAIAIIVSLGSLACLGCGVAGHLGALSHLDKMTCYGLMGGGSLGLVAIALISFFLGKNWRQGMVPIWKKHGLIKDEIPMPEAIKIALRESPNLIPILIPAITVAQLEKIASEMGLKMEISIPAQYDPASKPYLKNEIPHWVLWKTGMAYDFSNYRGGETLPEGLQTESNYEVPSAIQAAIGLLAEFGETGQLRSSTIACHALPRHNNKDTTNYLSIESRNQTITFKLFSGRSDKPCALNTQRLIKRY